MRFRSAGIAVLLMATAGGCTSVREPTSETGPSAIDLSTRQGRAAAVVEANVIATHAYQVLLAATSGRGDQDCYSPAGLAAGDLEAIVNLQAALLRMDTVSILNWIGGASSDFQPSTALLPMLQSTIALSHELPVNVLTRYLADQTGRPAHEVRSVANLYQTCLEVERDGDLLWDLYHFYIALGFPVYVGQLGLPGTDEDFLQAGKQLEGSCCESPFDTDAAAWRIAGRKVWNWGEKKLHRRDRFTIARELLIEPWFRSRLLRLKAVPPQKIAVIGHSFTMDSHWSSPGSFASIVDAILQMENPGVRTRQWFGGGLTAVRAQRQFYDEVAAWAPDRVLFAVAIRSPEDVAALKRMTAGLTGAGAVVHVFDSLMDPSEDAGLNLFTKDQEPEWGFRVIAVREHLSASPDRETFLCLDGIHMTEPYHRLMAREWLRALIGGEPSRAGAAAP